MKIINTEGNIIRTGISVRYYINKYLIAVII